MTEDPTPPDVRAAEPATPSAAPSAAPSASVDAHYDVVLLVEQALSPVDARQVRSLHEGVEEPVRYHVVLPVEDAAARVEAALGTMSSGDALSAPSVPLDREDLEALRGQSQRAAAEALATSARALEEAGGVVGSRRATDGGPVDALAAVITEVDGREAIVLTRSHVIAEFFHVDWASQARRHLGIPVLHLVEQETFDEQAHGGEGLSGF